MDLTRPFEQAAVGLREFNRTTTCSAVSLQVVGSLKVEVGRFSEPVPSYERSQNPRGPLNSCCMRMLEEQPACVVESLGGPRNDPSSNPIS